MLVLLPSTGFSTPMAIAVMPFLSTSSHTTHHAARSAHPGLVSTAAAHHPTVTHPSHSTSMLPSSLHSLILGMFLFPLVGSQHRHGVTLTLNRRKRD